MALLSNLGKYKNTGLLLLRIGVGIMFILHGYPKLAGGPEMWKAVGGAMKNIHITFYPVFWGLMAALTETFGGFLFLIGLAFRPACLLLAFVMLMAAMNHFAMGQGFNEASHPIEAGIVFIGMAFIGPGKYSVDKK
ncbi:DoxX family protein (plasmid) [Pedobacter sp. BS3]|uniref:DoxX family protein n=1 Tax=Pedobacter sp. BS3 TaxID=2567937 RepID=UPI0011F014A7|nr:DoxX family protein [Pedobacter sp. BS3]TZF85964.1 DoxX family protein [Pedobacter sp. BS3]